MKTINERIAQCIVMSGLTKTAFAKRINLSQPHISKIASGISTPSDRTIADICREFNVNETWLRTGEGDLFNAPPETLADKLAQEYGLDDLGRQIMAAYLKLDERERLAVGQLIQNVVDERVAVKQSDQQAIWEAEARAAAEAVYQQVLDEKRAEADYLK